jgi:RNA polymerase sigma-70 factor (ECF subfamily)
MHVESWERQPSRFDGATLVVGRVSAAAEEVVDMGELEVADEVLIAREVSARAEDPDHDIVNLVKAGSLDAALRTLMRRHGTAVFRYCREALRDAALAEDVHQHVFIQAYRDLARFGGRSTMRTWLFAIARHRVLDAAKARRRALAHLEEDDTADPPDLTPAADEAIDDARLCEALVACVGKLGEHMRTAVLLRFQQGFTFEQMAEVCGEKPGTLQARVVRALPRLRECIEARTGGRL